MATLPIKLLTGGNRIQGGIGLFQPHDSQKIIKIGPMGAVEWTSNLTEVEARSDESGTSQLTGKYITQSDSTISVADIQTWTPWLYDSLFLLKRTYWTQEAVASATLDIEDITIGDVIEVPGINPSVVSMKDKTPSTPKSYTEDVDGDGDGHYIFQSQRKLLEFVGKPSGATPDGQLTYSLPEITEDDKVVKLEIMKTAGTRGKFFVLGVVDDSQPGEPVDYVFYDVEFRPNGNVPLKDASALNVGSLTGTIYNTGGQGYGYIRPYTP
jgi:hypothetical protein